VSKADPLSTESPPETSRRARGGGRRAATRPSRRSAVGRFLRGPVSVTVWCGIVLAGLVAILAAALDLAPEIVSTVGGIAITVAYVWALAVRTGGRPIVFGALALAIGAAVLLTDQDAVRSGAAVLATSLSAVLAVMLTKPAVTVVGAAREVVGASVVAAIGAVAAVGMHPLIALARFEYTTLVLSMLLVFALVFRLGAGIHGLGRRGAVILVGGAALMALGLAYAELLRLYGTPGFVSWVLDVAAWSEEHLRGFPRPMPALLGIPMLLWGCHLRARRRQGWWACAFGVVGLVPFAHLLADPRLTLVNVALTSVYSLLAGLVLGVLLIRVDLLLSGSGGRRSARA
jgi:hypothetical protein